MVSRLQSLAVRPPTPPPSKGNDNSTEDADLLDFINDPFATNTTPAPASLFVTKALLSTPRTSPLSDGPTPSSSTSRKKRVNFDSRPCPIPASTFPLIHSTPLRSSPLRPLPQTRVSKPLKSILKPIDATCTPPPADQSTPAQKYNSFAEMLESIMKQLASPTRASRFDAYHSLQRALQAYNNVPDTKALLDKMGLLTHFIQRDAQAPGINGTGLDSQLIGQALKLLMALVRIPALKPGMSEEFCVFMLERIIKVTADKEMPKTIANTHLATLMQQNFPPKVMTAARVERILDVLDTIHERVTGQSVLAYRIRIYRKLIQQKQDVMVKHTGRWFKHTVQALLSVQKDINQSALDTAITAAKTFGEDSQAQVAKSVLAILNHQKRDGSTIAKTMVNELEKMLATDNAVLVPHIWSAVTALLMGSLEPEQFPAFTDWLRLYNKCLESTDDTVRTYAIAASGFLVYAVNMKEDTNPTWSRFFLGIHRHLLQQQRRSQVKSYEREAAQSAYFVLLYYSLNPLNPSTSAKQLDRYWKEFVADFWSPPNANGTINPAHAIAACRVMSALLDGSRKPWDRQRALDLRPQAMVQREELPLLDPMWVRKSLAPILRFVETLLDSTPWAINNSKDEPATAMWLSLLQSLKLASSQEVRASSESKDAMAHIVNLLRRMWDTHGAQLAISQQKEDNWANKFCYLLETTVEKLGVFAFADKCLSRNQQDEIEVASTPSRSRQQEPRTSPLIYFVDLLLNQSEGKLDDAVRLRAMKLLVEPCFNAQQSRLARLEMLRDFSTLLDTSLQSDVAADFLADVATLMKRCIQEPLEATGGSRQLGKEYELVVETFSLGTSHYLQQRQAQELLATFVKTVRDEAGEGAVVLAVIEQVSERILLRIPESSRRNGLALLSILLQNLPKVIHHRVIDNGRHKIWPSSPKSVRNADFDPYNHFYPAAVSIGSAAYKELSAYDVEEVRDYLTALAHSVRSCPMNLLAVYLRRVQATICLWIQDADQRLQVKEQPLKSLHSEVVKLWKEVCAAIERLPKKDSQTLVQLEPLITAGFVSRRRGIVKMSSTTWNATFGQQDTLRYPAQLEQALRRVQTAFGISLPSLEARDGDADGTVVFYESDESSEASRRKLQSPRIRESPFRISKSSRKSASPTVSSVSSKRTSTRKTPKVRLRHDNSQIQFEPIASSPLNPFNQESQLLTERQRDMRERQITGNNNLFASIGSTSSPIRPRIETSVQSPLELHSDALSADDLPMENAQTPLRRIPPLGPEEVFLGSSPTPLARSRTQEVVSDQTSLATPTAVRTVQLANDDDDLGSSPPRFEKDAASSVLDEGTTFDETILEVGDIEMLGGETSDLSSAPELVALDMPSSTIDLQLTAQIDAEIKARKEGDAEPAARQEIDTEFEEVSSISRVEDSFSSQVVEGESSQVRTTRSSARQSAIPSPAPSTKRAGRPKKVKEEVSEAPISSVLPTDKANKEDTIVVESPKIPKSTRKSRKSLPATLPTEVMVPETIRKRGPRSVSLLNQVETHSDDVVVEDTPALKRARTHISQDVSGAKSTPSRGSQARRLSHVRVTPKSHSSLRSSSSVTTEVPLDTTIQDISPEDEQVDTVTPQLPNVTMASDEPQHSAPSQSQHDSGEVAAAVTPSRSFTERAFLTPRSIINQLKKFKDTLVRNSEMVFRREEVKEMSDVMSDITFVAGSRSVKRGRGD